MERKNTSQTTWSHVANELLGPIENVTTQGVTTQGMTTQGEVIAHCMSKPTVQR